MIIFFQRPGPAGVQLGQKAPAHKLSRHGLCQTTAPQTAEPQRPHAALPEKQAGPMLRVPIHFLKSVSEDHAFCLLRQTVLQKMNNSLEIGYGQMGKNEI